MRKPTARQIREQQLLLRSLEDDYQRLNRPTISKELRMSLFTRIEELRSRIARATSQTDRASIRIVPVVFDQMLAGAD